jgi:hypothetical protein
VKAGTTTFDDSSVLLGDRYSYQVLANSLAGESKRSGQANVSVPRPPLAEAQLSDNYSVMLEVTFESFLTEVEGIKDPKPGDTRRESWAFAATCGPDEGACPVKWYSHSPALMPHGPVYSGTVREKGHGARRGARWTSRPCTSVST